MINVPLVLLLILGVVAVVVGGWLGLLFWALATGCGLAFASAVDSENEQKKRLDGK